MTRVSAANGGACPEGPAQGLSGEAALRFALAWARRPIEALERAHRRFPAATVRRRVVPPAALVGAAVAIVAIVALTLQHLALERDLALGAAAARGRHEGDASRPAARRGAGRRTACVRRRNLSPRPRRPSRGAVRQIDPHRPQRASGRIRPDPSRRQFAACDPRGRPEGCRRGRRLGRRDSLQNAETTRNLPPCGLCREPRRGSPSPRRSISISLLGAERGW